MSRSSAPHQNTQDPAGRWAPRLGDLAYDSHAGKTGVVVDVPGPDAGDLYHLRPEQGGPGDEWTAPADGSLSPQNAQDAR